MRLKSRANSMKAKKTQRRGRLGSPIPVISKQAWWRWRNRCGPLWCLLGSPTRVCTSPATCSSAWQQRGENRGPAGTPSKAASEREEKGRLPKRRQWASRCTGPLGPGRGSEVMRWRWLGPSYPAPWKGAETKTAEGGKDQIRFSFYELVSVHLILSLALCRCKCHSAADCISNCHSSNSADTEIHFLGFQDAVDTSLWGRPSTYSVKGIITRLLL